MQKLLKKSDLILKYLVAAILLVVPLYPKFPFLKVPGTFVSIRLEDFILLFASFLLILLVASDIKKFIKDRLNRAIILYLFTGLISLMSAVLVLKTVVPHLGLLHWLRRIEYFVPFFLGFYALKRQRENLEFYLKVLMVSIGLSFLFGLGQRYLQWPVIVTQNLEYSQGIALRYGPGSHINSTFAGHYDLGTFLVFLLPIYITLFLLVKKIKSKLVVLLIIFGGLWLLAYSGSRISVVSYLLSATFSLVLIKKYKAIPFMIAVSLLIFSFSPSLATRYSRLIKMAKDKLLSVSQTVPLSRVEMVYAQEAQVGIPQRRKVPTPTPTPLPVFEDRSTAIRLNIEWPRAIRAFSKNPLLGTGYSSLTLATDNDLLRILGEVGILGFLAFSLIFVRIIKRIVRVFPLTKNFKGAELAFVAGVAGAIPGILTNAVLLDIFEASKFAIIFWLVIGMLISLLNYNYYEDNI